MGILGDKLTRDRVNRSLRTSERQVETYRIPKGSPLSSKPRSFIVISESYDYLTCHTWDGTTEGTDDVLVAKPWFLRRAPFEGYERNGCTFAYTGVSSRTVTRTSDLSTEDQVILPSYEPKSASWPGDVIWAISATTLAFANPPNDPISLLEVFSARQWCANCMNCQAI